MDFDFLQAQNCCGAYKEGHCSKTKTRLQLCHCVGRPCGNLTVQLQHLDISWEREVSLKIFLFSGLSSVTSAPQTLPPSLSLSSCHASGHPAIRAGPPCSASRGFIDQALGPRQNCLSRGELLKVAGRRRGNRFAAPMG